MYLYCKLSECIRLLFSCISSLLLLFFWIHIINPDWPVGCAHHLSKNITSLSTYWLYNVRSLIAALQPNIISRWYLGKCEAWCNTPWSPWVNGCSFRKTTRICCHIIIDFNHAWVILMSCDPSLHVRDKADGIHVCSSYYSTDVVGLSVWRQPWKTQIQYINLTSLWKAWYCEMQ